MNTIERAETRQMEIALAKSMRDNNLPEEEVRVTAELQGLDYNSVMLQRSQLFEDNKNER